MNISNNIHQYNFKNTPTFKAGKVHLYSDFDHTFIPMNIWDFQNKCFAGKLNLQNYFKKMNKFIRRAGKNFKFTITTARTVDDFIDTGYCAINHKVKMPFPKVLITRDGQRKYRKILPDFIGGKMNYYPSPWSWFSRCYTADKKYDTTREIYKSINKKNFVISAGDGLNDSEMLNPMTYLEYYMKKYTGDKNYQLNYELSKKGIETFFERNQDLKTIFKELPFIGIVISRNKYPERFTKLISAFGPESGDLQKLVIVEEGELLNGVKQAIEIFSKNFSKSPKHRPLKKSIIKATKFL